MPASGISAPSCSAKKQKKHKKKTPAASGAAGVGVLCGLSSVIPGGNVCAIVVPCPARFPGGFGRRDDFIIPWNCIKRIGPDIVLVEAKPDDCRVPRGKPGLPR